VMLEPSRLVADALEDLVEGPLRVSVRTTTSGEISSGCFAQPRIELCGITCQLPPTGGKRHERCRRSGQDRERGGLLGGCVGDGAAL